MPDRRGHRASLARPLHGVVAVASLAIFSGLLRAPAASTTQEPALRLAQTAAQDTVFRHADHRSVECLVCHTMGQAHGRLLVQTLQDCRSCHHAPEQPRDCAACHEDIPREARVRPRVETLSIGPELRERELPFDHATHADLECRDCHTRPPSLSAAATTCASCHEQHHRLEADCSSCHREAPEGTHELEEVHRGCSGVGCHEALPIPGMLQERAGCLVCHQDLRDHHPERACVACHVLPLAEPAATGGRR